MHEGRRAHGRLALPSRHAPSDREWNTLLAETAWERRAGSALTFDRSGTLERRIAISRSSPRSRLGDGDYRLPSSLRARRAARWLPRYEAHQLGNATTDLLQDQWRDGIRVIADRAVQIRLLDPVKTIHSFTDVNAQDYILHADYLSVGHRRGVTEPASRPQ
jgi:hypothetical protein